MIAEYAVALGRYVTPVLAVWILFRCARSMLKEKYEPEVWGYLSSANGNRAPLMHWENIAGRSRSSDIVLDHKTISRTHAALIRDGKGAWTVFDLGGKNGVKLNGADIESQAPLENGDTLTFAEVDLKLTLLSADERSTLSETRTKPGRIIRPGLTFFILTLFHMMLAMQHMFSADADSAPVVVLSFFAATAIMWVYFLAMRASGRAGFEVETIAFFLSALGLSVAAVSTPGDMLKQLFLQLGGITFFIVLGRWLRGLNRAKSASIPVAVLAVGFLAVNLIFAERIMGAKNWLFIAGFSVQPSEFVKIAFVYTGAATLDRLFSKKNLFVFIVFSVICVGALVLMGDFGTALVFFGAFLVTAYMRSGNLATVFLAVTAAVLAGFLMLSVKPYIAARFETWGHIWESPYGAGFQQTRALAAAASGGLFGGGAGSGWFRSIIASDTDLAFALICEESGLITALCAVFALPVAAVFTVKNAAMGRSSFYVIAACCAVSMMMLQMSLNVFGSLDIIPFTGITFPFVSRGGSSLVSCWASLAFVKAADTRQNAGFSSKSDMSRGPGKKRGGEG